MNNKRARLIAQAENPKSSMFFKIKVAIAILVTAGFTYLAWYSYSTQISNINEADLPLIKAPTDTLKYKPEDPGGLKIEHKDKEIYDHISGKKMVRTERVKDDYDEPDTFEKIKKSIGIPTKPKTNPVEVKPVIIDVPPSNTSKYRKVIKPTTYHVRVAALRSSSVMNEAWNILKTRYPYLKKYSPKITTIEKNGKKMHFLDVGVIRDKSEANSICQKIAKSGGKCKVY